MAPTENFIVILFDSTNHAIRAEDLVQAAGFKLARVIPTPRDISSDCGVVLRVLAEDKEGVLELLEEKGAGWRDVVGLHQKIIDVEDDIKWGLHGE